MDNIKFIFGYNRTAYYLPINPEKFEVSVNGKNKVIETINGYEINIMSPTAPAEINMTFYLPHTSEESCPYIRDEGKWMPPDTYINLFESIRNGRDTVDFIVTGTRVAFNMSIETFSYVYDGLSDMVVCNIKLKYSGKALGSYLSGGGNFSVNEQVVVNGQLFGDSYGNSGGKTVTDFYGIISYVKNDGRSHPYHVSTLEGLQQGWVKAENLRSC